MPLPKSVWIALADWGDAEWDITGGGRAEINTRRHSYPVTSHEAPTYRFHVHHQEQIHRAARASRSTIVGGWHTIMMLEGEKYPNFQGHQGWGFRAWDFFFKAFLNWPSNSSHFECAHGARVETHVWHMYTYSNIVLVRCAHQRIVAK
jgi:hypothetical protein